MKRLAFIFAVMLLSSVGMLAQETVAVYVTGDDKPAVKKVFGSKFVAAIVNKGEYRAVERTDSFLEQLSKETAYQQSGAVSDSKISQIGKQLGADMVCAIDISNVFGEKYISAKLISTETAEVLKVRDMSENWEDLSGLTEVAENLAAELVGAKKTAKKDPNGLKQIQINYQNYEVLPGDLDGTYTWSNAKSACANLTAFGKSDWYLPTKAELDGLYKRKDEIGGFTGDWYWSSSEYDSNYAGAWEQRFSGGDQNLTSPKYNYYARVRCVRKY